MTVHTCGTFTAAKTFGSCLCCSQPVYDILETFAGGPLQGQAARVGLMQPHGTQVELLLSNGSVCHFDFCVDCATNIRPEDLWAVWQTHVELTDEIERLAGRRDAQRRMSVRTAARLWPVGVVGWRRQDRERIHLVPDGLVVDRRRPPPPVDEPRGPAWRAAPRSPKEVPAGAH